MAMLVNETIEYLVSLEADMEKLFCPVFKAKKHELNIASVYWVRSLPYLFNKSPTIYPNNKC